MKLNKHMIIAALANLPVSTPPRVKKVTFTQRRKEQTAQARFKKKGR